MRPPIYLPSNEKNYPGCTLHQIGPYIGKIRPSLARQLIKKYSKTNQWIWDPFCGSGTISLEARLLSRNNVAGDINPYACALTRAKLHAPLSVEKSLSIIDTAAEILKNEDNGRNTEIPVWVKKFFHEQTLLETIALMKYFKKNRYYFHIGCLLGILHHQRPGFLSFPASHLVPYLRDKLYTPHLYPEAYQYRDPIPRLKRKVVRMLKYPPKWQDNHFYIHEKSIFSKYLPEASVDIIITSPPYLDALDYTRDNRLRLWFLGLDDTRDIKSKEIQRTQSYVNDMLTALNVMFRTVKSHGLIILIFGDVTRGQKNYDVPKIISACIKEYITGLHIEQQWTDILPNSRRSRRNSRATKKETIMVLKKK